LGSGELRVNQPGRRAWPSLSHPRPGTVYRQDSCATSILVVDELALMIDSRMTDGFWNHGGHLLKGQRGAVGNGFVLARGVNLAQVHLGHALPKSRRIR